MTTDLQMSPTYIGRVIQTVSQVLAAGKWWGLFDDKADGWFSLASKQGDPILGLSTSPVLGGYSAAHRICVEREVSWLVAWMGDNKVSTTSLFHEQRGSPAVVFVGHNLLFSYTSDLDYQWNEAIAVVTAIRMDQFRQELISDKRFDLQTNPKIVKLLEVTN